MAKKKHLTLSNRIVIESNLSSGANFRSIAKELKKSPSTIDREAKEKSVSRFVKVPHHLIWLHKWEHNDARSVK